MRAPEIATMRLKEDYPSEQRRTDARRKRSGDCQRGFSPQGMEMRHRGGDEKPRGRVKRWWQTPRCSSTPLSRPKAINAWIARPSEANGAESGAERSSR